MKKEELEQKVVNLAQELREERKDFKNLVERNQELSRELNSRNNESLNHKINETERLYYLIPALIHDHTLDEQMQPIKDDGGYDRFNGRYPFKQQ